GVLFVVTALAMHYMNRYSVFLDTSMLRNVFHTDFKEASELFSFGMTKDLVFYGILPALIVWRIDLRRHSLPNAFLARVLFMLSAALIAGVALAIAFQDLSALMRNQRELRYLITPAN